MPLISGLRQDLMLKRANHFFIPPHPHLFGLMEQKGDQYPPPPQLPADKLLQEESYGHSTLVPAMYHFYI